MVGSSLWAWSRCWLTMYATRLWVSLMLDQAIWILNFKARSNVESARSSSGGPKNYSLSTSSTNFFTTQFFTLLDLGQKLSLSGGVDHIGFVKESFIQWHMNLTLLNSYDIFHLISFKHNTWKKKFTVSKGINKKSIT